MGKDLPREKKKENKLSFPLFSFILSSCRKKCFRKTSKVHKKTQLFLLMWKQLKSFFKSKHFCANRKMKTAPENKICRKLNVSNECFRVKCKPRQFVGTDL